MTTAPDFLDSEEFLLLLKNLRYQFAELDGSDFWVEAVKAAIRAHFAPREPLVEKLAELRSKMVDLPPEFAQIVNENFWDLLA